MKRLALVKLSRADGGQQQPDRGGDEGLDRVAVADGGDEQDAEQGEGGVLRRAEVERVAGDDRAEQRQADDRDGGAEEGADRRDAEGGAGLALLGQGEAVEDGHHRAGLTGDAEQHRGDGAAVLRAVVDAGEHDDRRDGVVGVVGDGQQDGHRGGGAEARQHADEHADDDADQAVEQVGRLRHDHEAVEEGVPVHRGLLSGSEGEQVGQRDLQGVEEQQVERRGRGDRDDDRAAPGLARRGSAARRCRAATAGISKPMTGSSRPRPTKVAPPTSDQQARPGELLGVVEVAADDQQHDREDRDQRPRPRRATAPGRVAGATRARSRRRGRPPPMPRARTTSAADDLVRRAARGRPFVGQVLGDLGLELGKDVGLVGRARLALAHGHLVSRFVVGAGVSWRRRGRCRTPRRGRRTAACPSRAAPRPRHRRSPSA